MITDSPDRSGLRLLGLTGAYLQILGGTVVPGSRPMKMSGPQRLSTYLRVGTYFPMSAVLVRRFVMSSNP
jgi:hypothetical protein